MSVFSPERRVAENGKNKIKKVKTEFKMKKVLYLRNVYIHT